jgi:tetratricopeptide (TPR) repeat protein
MKFQETRPTSPLHNANPVSPQLVEEQLDRIGRHPLFANSHSLRAFLEYVVRKTLAGASDQIKEYTIATEVLGRNESFDTRDTSLVRTKAFNVRSKLKAYYERDGVSDPVLIVLEPGSYVPIFRLAPAGQPSPNRAPHSEKAIRLALESVDSNNPACQPLLDSFLRYLTISLVQSNPFYVATLAPSAGENPADFVIRCDLQQSSAQVTFDLQAQQIPSNYVVWARRFTWDQADFDASRSASHIAVQLSRAILNLVGVSPTTTAPLNPAVSAACEEGYGFLARNNPADCRRAERRFLHAVDIDQNSAAAHAGFAFAVLQGALLGDSSSTAAVVDAEVSALQALASDFHAPYSQLARGAALALVEWDLTAALRYLHRAEQFLPSDRPDALFAAWSALLKLIPERRLSEAILQLQPIVRIFPSHLFARFVLGTALRLDRRYPEAISVFSASYEFDVQCGISALNIAWAFAASGDLKKAQESLQGPHNNLGRIPSIVGLQGYLAGAQGQHDLAISLETELTRMAKPHASYFFERALIAHGLGQNSKARSLLAMSVHAQEPAAFLGRMEPLLASLSSPPSDAF